MKILLLGKDGQLGWELHRALFELDKLKAIGRADLDLIRTDALRELTRELAPDLIINAAGYIDVDRAESEAHTAFNINTTIPTVLAEEAASTGGLLVHISSDYVFDGTKKSPYTEGDTPNPLNLYGKSKLAAERAIRSSEAHHLILRTSWIFGMRRPSFVTRILAQRSSPQEIKVVDNQVGSPTWARALAGAIGDLVLKAEADGMEWLQERGGLYHLAGLGSASRFEWAKAILAIEAKRTGEETAQLKRVSSEEYPAKANRPAFSALNCDKFQQIFGFQLPEWKLSLAQALDR